jgi:putative SOS response-associated peptidase YedK
MVKQPYCFEVNEGALFAFAGLWDGLTTTPNAVTAPVHDRMPVILQPDRYNLWLDPGATNVQVILKLSKPYDAQLMRRYPVSGRINHVSNDDPECSHLSNLLRIGFSFSSCAFPFKRSPVKNEISDCPQPPETRAQSAD